MMMPSMVRNERSLLAAMALRAILKRFEIFIVVRKSGMMVLLSSGGMSSVLRHWKLCQGFGCRSDVVVDNVFLDLSVAQYDVAA